MTNYRSDDILRRHRYRPLVELVTPVLGLAALALTAVGVGTAGGSYGPRDSDLGELPVSAECIHVAGVDTSAG